MKVQEDAKARGGYKYSALPQYCRHLNFNILLKMENISKNMSVFFSLFKLCVFFFLFWQTYICTIFIKLFRKLLFLDGCHLAVIDQSVLHSTKVFLCASINGCFL